MKFKHLLLTASVMALFSSCSNDELVSENTSHGDAIAFSVTTTNATRAADYWCNNNLPQFFEVSATYFDGTSTATYFDGDMYKKDTGITYTPNDGSYRYWPDLTNKEGTEKYLNVYAYKVKDDESATGTAFATFNWNNGSPTITYDMSSRKNASDQYDLLYAYTKVTEKPGFGKTAPINFRHALSQIVFEAKCDNNKIHVEIEEIALMNAAKSGIFTLPSNGNTTNDNFVEHDQAGTKSQPSNGLGTWALTYEGTGEGDTFVKSNNYRGYIASCKSGTELKVVGANWTNLTDNTNTEDGKHKNIEQSLLVLPQTKYTGEGAKDNSVKAYNPVPMSGTYKALSDVGGACIAIRCKIQNIAGDTYNKATDVYLWGDKDNAKDLVVPVDFTWEQGKKYIYRINFAAKGHGGYDPDNGKEVLVPIKLDVTVDDFAKVTEITPNF